MLVESIVITYVRMRLVSSDIAELSGPSYMIIDLIMNVLHRHDKLGYRRWFVRLKY